MADPRPHLPGRQLVDFAAPSAADAWSVVNDGVMGGLSSSRFRSSGAKTCVFEGEVSLENGGGFASARREIAAGDLQAADAIHLAFAGDGHSYKLRLRMAESSRAPSYEAEFATNAGSWSTQRFPLAALQPMWRGRPVPGAEPLDPSRVCGLGILIGGRQAGPFRLELGALTVESSVDGPVDPAPFGQPEA